LSLAPEVEMSSSNTNVFAKSPLFQPEKLVQSEKVADTGFKQVRLSKTPSSPYQPSPLYNPNVQPPVNKAEPDRRKRSGPQPPAEEEDPLFKEVLPPQANEDPVPEPATPPVAEPKTKQPPTPAPAEPVVTVDIEEVRQEAYKKGFEEAKKQMLEEYKSSGVALLNVADQLNQVREVIIQNSIGELQDLVITIAEKIIRHSITAQDDTIVATVEESIRKAVKSSDFYICLNSEDYSVIHEKAPELISKISGLENIFLKIDDGIEPGGCIIESDNCTIDATIASQLQIIKDHLTSRR